MLYKVVVQILRCLPKAKRGTPSEALEPLLSTSAPTSCPGRTAGSQGRTF